MAVIYSITFTNKPKGKFYVQTFTPQGWIRVGTLKSEKKAKKFADLFAEATGNGVRVEKSR